MHDYPYFFNPDERNMASAITRFRLPGNLNPHFFAYGQFPLYLAFVSDQIFQIFTRRDLVVLQGLSLNNLSTSFPSAIFWLRFYSALSSTLTVLLVYLITKELFKNVQTRFVLARQAGYIATLSAAFAPGLIQSAHFGTTESLLTFFFLASVYLSMKLLRLSNLSDLSHLGYLFLLSLVIGLSLGSKLTGVFFFIPPLISLTIRTIKKKNVFENLKIACLPARQGLLVFIGSIFFFIISSPYNWVEPENFQSAVFGYEADVAMGKYEAFYTRQFVDSIPILFQAEKIFPYALGLPLFILGTFGFLYITIKLITLVLIAGGARSGSPKIGVPLRVDFGAVERQAPLIIIIFAFLIYFLPNSFLFAKWTRFMTPILPFFAIFAGYFLFILVSSRPKECTIWYVPKWRDLWKQKIPGQARNDNVIFAYLLICLFVITSILPGVAFMSIYTHDDTRVTASEWIYQNVPDKSYILSETANVVDIPLGLAELTTHNLQLTTISFDFYHLDENPKLFEELLTHLEKADYILIPSRRIFANYPKLPQKYPLVTKYYQLLFDGSLGFEKVNETSVLDDEQAEETFTVFDHPVIRIYRKVKQLNKEELGIIFNS